MLYGSMGISIFMIIISVVVLSLAFKKLKYITPFNMTIYLILGVFWISITMFKEQLSYEAPIIKGDWGLPLIIAASTMIQVFFRLPIGKLAQKLRSRKIPLLLLVTIFICFSTPFIFVVNSATFTLLALSFGLFGASFGMQNQYFAENWSLRNTFTTVALMSFLPALGVFVTNVFHSAYTLSDKDVNHFRDFFHWILLSTMVVLVLTTLFYAFKHKENKESIRLDNITDENKVIASLTLKDVFRMSSVILFIGMANQLVFRRSETMISDVNLWTFLYIIITALTLIVAVVTAMFLIKKYKSFTLATIAQISTFVGILLGVIMWFGNIHSIALSIIFMLIFAVSISVYETTIFGTIIHFDHKNKYLVLGIWLSIRSFGYSVGDGFGGVIEDNYNSFETSKWIVFAGLIITIIGITLSFAFYKKNKVIYDIVDKYENTKSNWREHIWRVRK